jgi:hypothetical protein
VLEVERARGATCLLTYSVNLLSISRDCSVILLVTALCLPATVSGDEHSFRMHKTIQASDDNDGDTDGPVDVSV